MPSHRPGALLRRAATLVVPLAALVLAGCPEPEPTPIVHTDPARWEPRIRAENDEFEVTDTIEVTSTEENALTELKERMYRRTVELAIKDLLRDESKYAANQAEIERLFLGQPMKYVASYLELQRAELEGGARIGLKARVQVARDKLSKGLQREGILKLRQMRVVLIVRRPAAGAAEVSPLAEGYLDDLAEELSREMMERGFRPRLWKDVRLGLAERRDDLDEDLEQFLVKYVEESDWRNPADERYELPMIVLRAEGRLLCGFSILELKKKELAYHVTMRADAYDLLNQQSLGYEVASDREVIGDGTLLETRQALVTRTAKGLIAKLGGVIEELLSREGRLRRNHYRFTFEGYQERELERIETLLAGIVAEDVDSSNDGTRLVVEADIPREPIPVRDEIARTLKRMGLTSRPARRQGTTMTFIKQ